MKKIQSINLEVITNDSPSVSYQLENFSTIQELAQNKLSRFTITSRSSSLMKEIHKSYDLIIQFCRMIENGNLQLMIEYFLERWNQIDPQQRKMIVSLVHTHFEVYQLSQNESDRQLKLLEKITRECFLDPNVVGYWTGN